MPKVIRAVETLKTYFPAKLIVIFRYPYIPLGFVFFLILKEFPSVETLKALFPASEMHFHINVNVGSAHLSHLYLIIYLSASLEMLLLRCFTSVLILFEIYFHLTTN